MELPEAMKPINPKDVAAVDKVPLWLCSPIAKAYWAAAMYSGLAKYGAWNWRIAGARLSVLASALQRHLDSYISGEEYDPIDGTHHLGNIMACASILLEAREAGRLVDDRPPIVGHRGAYLEVEANVEMLRKKYEEVLPRHWNIFDSPALELTEDDLEENQPE